MGAGRGRGLCVGTSVSAGASAGASAREITFRGRVIQDKDCLHDVNKVGKRIHVHAPARIESLRQNCKLTDDD